MMWWRRVASVVKWAAIATTAAGSSLALRSLEEVATTSKSDDDDLCDNQDVLLPKALFNSLLSDAAASSKKYGNHCKLSVVVVGAGVSGLSTAWGLAKMGHKVTILGTSIDITNDDNFSSFLEATGS